MKRLIRRLFHLIKGSFIVISYFIFVVPCRIILKRKSIWLVSEREHEARDNGFSLFKYIKSYHKNINCFYAINFKSSDYNKVKSFGNVVNFGSFKHFIYFCGAKYIISSTTEGFCPSGYLELIRRKIHLFGIFVFLQHGITKDNQPRLHKKKAKIDLFICGAQPEYADIANNYGYRKNEVVYTGFARFDSYHNIVTKNQILVMPTWRKYIVDNDFGKSDFFTTWNAVLNSQDLNSLLRKHDLKLLFFMHSQIKKFGNYFSTNLSNIKICDFNGCDIQQLIKESKMLITDFSSLAFDFAYMKKPVLYYQFDEKKFFDSHYLPGYFKYHIDGFGPVCNSFKELLDSLNTQVIHNFVLEGQYLRNSDRFFPICDSNNSERIVQAIIKFNKTF